MKAVVPFLCQPDYPIAADWLDALRAALPEEDVVAFDELDDAGRKRSTVAIVANPRPQDVLRLPNLLWVQSVWAGVDRLLTELGESRIGIVRLVDPRLADTMAEAVLAWTLYLHRDMPRYASQQARHEWLAQPYKRACERTVGLLGLGALGEAAARRLIGAGFRVCGWTRRPRQVDGVECFAGPAQLHDMLARSDVVVCLLPLTPDTRRLLDTISLAHLPEGAALINFARGEVVDDDALRAALDTGRIAHAVLDVFDLEPLPAERWQWSHPRVTVLPHISAPTDRRSASAIVAANIRAYRATGATPTFANRARGY